MISGIINDILKQTLFEIDANKESIIEVSKFIHSHPESNYQEFQSSAYLVQRLRGLGFQVLSPVANLQTAFKARFDGNSPGPTIAIMAEYDALPITDDQGMTSVVHACGHNLNAGAAIGAAMGLKKMMKELPGSIIIMGTPAEEGGGGKVALLQAGVFSDIDIAMTVHGDQRDWYTVARSCSCSRSFEIEFTGKSVGMVDSRREYVNSMDAATLFLNALNILDYHITADTLIQRKIQPSSQASNAIPYKTTIEVAVRSGDEPYLFKIIERVKNAAEGAALAVGAEFTMTQKGFPYERIIENKTLEEIAKKNIELLGHKFTYDQMSPYPFGTDTGNISHRVPTLQFLIGRPEGFNFHTFKAVEQSISTSAHIMMSESAKIMAATAVDIFLNPDNVAKSKEELESYRQADFVGTYSWHYV